MTRRVPLVDGLYQHLDNREVDGKPYVIHWPLMVTERYCVDSGAPVRVPGDRCIRHGARGEMCTTAVRSPGRCEHPRLSPNHPYPHCSECGIDGDDVTAEWAPGARR
jgi:hypothetical protein